MPLLPESFFVIFVRNNPSILGRMGSIIGIYSGVCKINRAVSFSGSGYCKKD